VPINPSLAANWMPKYNGILKMRAGLKKCQQAKNASCDTFFLRRILPEEQE